MNFRTNNTTHDITVERLELVEDPKRQLCATVDVRVEGLLLLNGITVLRPKDESRSLYAQLPDEGANTTSIVLTSDHLANSIKAAVMREYFIEACR